LSQGIMKYKYFKENSLAVAHQRCALLLAG
jgi:hypothetical protein